MMRALRSYAAGVLVVLSALSVAGCAMLQADPLRLERENAELRRMLVETRRELDEVKRDQERLRASVEYLQYGRSGPASRESSIVAGTGGGYTPPGAERWPAGQWPGGGPTQDFPAEVSGQPGGDYQSSADLRSGVPPGIGPEASVTTATGPGPLAGLMPPPVGSDPRAAEDARLADNPDARVVLGVREDGNWSEPGVIVDSTPPAPPANLEGTLYADGLRALTEERFDEAIQFFRDYIHGDPTSPVADDAQYWIAESYRRKGMDTAAIKEFNQVAIRYASGDRSAAALLQLASLFSKMGDQVDARLSLQKLVNRYPRSREATQARAWLLQMGG